MELLEVIKFGVFATFVIGVTYYTFKLKKHNKHSHNHK